MLINTGTTVEDIDQAGKPLENKSLIVDYRRDKEPAQETFS